ncbi:MAG: peptidylprolyl isomerase [Candidatus Pristimantibacillus lignocellulolyticus]|uniref:Peptidyl-prolyl cis-trans isomerase n=1 Tax=Candidatus Pristimantibacillus lignocellulolyticus TaxID=2994561 RepID=A0A9J6ZHS6_9BACL|nr:MAG: peptidylprolyl isomerase [Candidatus Pristimantibacillus lignocellulolyticus]
MNFKSLTVLLVMLLVLSACGEPITNNSTSQGSTGNATATPTPTPTPEPELELLDSSQHPEVTIEMSNGGIIKLELYPEIAPNTVSNFVSLAQQGFYDGLIFHRVMPDFMIQGGDPEGTGMGGPGYNIKGEFTANGFENRLKHTRGVISMARSQSMDSAGSQFYIVQAKETPHLDGLYASFGMVTEGLDVVDEIVSQKRDTQDKPLEPLVMTKVTVDTKGLELAELEKM